jgi:plasmid stabilization system protein ParE
MGWKIIIAPSAQSDLADIVRYIARHNSDAAARLGYELITRAENLADFPEIGRIVAGIQAAESAGSALPFLSHHLPAATRRAAH